MLDGQVLPYAQATANFHHEVELVAAIGTSGRNVLRKAALDHAGSKRLVTTHVSRCCMSRRLPIARVYPVVPSQPNKFAIAGTGAIVVFYCVDGCYSATSDEWIHSVDHRR
jgi:hypothetical protein